MAKVFGRVPNYTEIIQKPAPYAGLAFVFSIDSHDVSCETVYIYSLSLDQVTPFFTTLAGDPAIVQ